jgi:ATP-dependent Clp protease ATP-binding subunit ClpB
LEIEREAIKRENNEVRLNELNKELAGLNEQRNGLAARWKAVMQAVQRLEEEREPLLATARSTDATGAKSSSP